MSLRIHCLLPLFLAFLVTSFAQAANPTVTLTNDEYEILKSINAERAQNGLKPIETQAQLVLAARTHSSEMLRIDRTEHVINGVDAGARIKAQGITWWQGTGEIAAHSETPQQAMQAWLASPAHRAHILTSEYAMIGVGVSATDSRGSRFWSCVFISFRELEGASGTVILPAERPVPMVEPSNWKVAVNNNSSVILKVFKINASNQLELLMTLRSGDHQSMFLPEGTRVVVRRTDTQTKIRSLTVGASSESLNFQF